MTMENNNIEKTELEKKEERAKFFLDTKINAFTEFEKQRMYEKKLAELKKIFNVLDADTLSLVNDTIHSVARMSAELRNLEEVIRINGQVEKYNNGGGQSGYKTSVTSDAYNKMKKTYLADMKLLIDLLNKDSEIEKSENKSILDEFINMKN